MQNGILLVIKLIPIKNDCNASALELTMKILFAQGEHIFVVVEYVFAHAEYVFGSGE